MALNERPGRQRAGGRARLVGRRSGWLGWSRMNDLTWRAEAERWWVEGGNEQPGETKRQQARMA